MNPRFTYSNIIFTRRIGSFSSNLSIVWKKISVTFGKIIISDNRLFARGLVFKSIDSPLSSENSSDYLYSIKESKLTLFGRRSGNSFSLTFRPPNKEELIEHFSSIGIKTKID